MLNSTKTAYGGRSTSSTPCLLWGCRKSLRKAVIYSEYAFVNALRTTDLFMAIGASHLRGAMEQLEITQQTIYVLKSNLQREWEQSVRIRSVPTGYDYLILSVQDTANVDDCSSAMSLSQFQQIAHLQVSTPCKNMDYALRWADAQLAVMKNGVASELMHS